MCMCVCVCVYVPRYVSCTAAGIIYESNEETVNVVVVSTAGVCLPFFFYRYQIEMKNKVYGKNK